jgi:hypothetical protein
VGDRETKFKIELIKKSYYSDYNIELPDEDSYIFNLFWTEIQNPTINLDHYLSIMENLTFNNFQQSKNHSPYISATAITMSMLNFSLYLMETFELHQTTKHSILLREQIHNLNKRTQLLSSRYSQENIENASVQIILRFKTYLKKNYHPNIQKEESKFPLGMNRDHNPPTQFPILFGNDIDETTYIVHLEKSTTAKQPIKHDCTQYNILITTDEFLEQALTAGEKFWSDIKSNQIKIHPNCLEHTLITNAPCNHVYNLKLDLSRPSISPINNSYYNSKLKEPAKISSILSNNSLNNHLIKKPENSFKIQKEHFDELLNSNSIERLSNNSYERKHSPIGRKMIQSTKKTLPKEAPLTHKLTHFQDSNNDYEDESAEWDSENEQDYSEEEIETEDQALNLNLDEEHELREAIFNGNQLDNLNV